MNIVLGIILPFLGTSLGAAGVLVMKNNFPKALQRSLLGFASGVMIAAGIWSLLLPAIEMAEHLKHFAFMPAAIGFAVGIIILILVDKAVNRLEMQREFKSTMLLIIAVTLHNIPEGMAVGVALAGVLSASPYITMSGAMSIAIGIAIQNIPEGTVISMPLVSEGKTKMKAFGIGVLSGIVEPMAAIITLILTRYVGMVLPYLLAFAAGAMYFVVANELLPSTADKKGSYIGTIGFAIGFLVMMILDVALG